MIERIILLGESKFETTGTIHLYQVQDYLNLQVSTNASIDKTKTLSTAHAKQLRDCLIELYPLEISASVSKSLEPANCLVYSEISRGVIRREISEDEAKKEAIKKSLINSGNTYSVYKKIGEASIPKPVPEQVIYKEV